MSRPGGKLWVEFAFASGAGKSGLPVWLPYPAALDIPRIFACLLIGGHRLVPTCAAGLGFTAGRSSVWKLRELLPPPQKEWSPNRRRRQKFRKCFPLRCWLRFLASIEVSMENGHHWDRRPEPSLHFHLNAPGLF